MANNTTQADIDLLRSAINSGELKIKHADRYVEYRSLTEMRAILADMEAAVYKKPKSKVFTICHDIGL